MPLDSGLLENLIEIFELSHFAIIGIIIIGLVRKISFIKDWIPFLALWLTYDLMKNIAEDHGHINVKPIYDLELKIFGWMFGGKIPAFWAQEHHNMFLDIFFTILYSLHVIVPIIVATSIYYKSKDRYLFKELSYAFILTTILALITYAIYPVAPPWYIWNDGNGLKWDQPIILTGIPGSAAGLVEVDRLLGREIFSSFYGRFNTNPFAALPSLHAAYSFMASYYTIKKYGIEKFWWMIFYPAGVLTAAVYLNHHYIVDLILGIVYIYFSIITVRTIRNYIEKISAEVRDDEIIQKEEATVPN